MLNPKSQEWRLATSNDLALTVTPLMLTSDRHN